MDWIIRYFWIMDRLKKEKIEVGYCPTGRMLADFFTKPLQGFLFRKMRDVVQGLAPINSLKTEEELKIEKEKSGKTSEVSDEKFKFDGRFESKFESENIREGDSFEGRSFGSSLLHKKERVGNDDCANNEKKTNDNDQLKKYVEDENLTYDRTYKDVICKNNNEDYIT